METINITLPSRVRCREPVQPAQHHGKRALSRLLGEIQGKDRKRGQSAYADYFLKSKEAGGCWRRLDRSQRWPTTWTVPAAP